MAADFDELLAAARPRKGPPCTVSVAFVKLDEPSAARLQQALDDEGEFSSTIARALSALLGEKVTPGIITRHRRGDCACP